MSEPRIDTELVILRVAAVRGSDYEFSHHQLLGRRAGLHDHDIERVRLGSTGIGRNDRQSLLLRVAEDERTILELVMPVGHYDMLGTTLNTLRVQPEDHQ